MQTITRVMIALQWLVATLEHIQDSLFRAPGLYLAPKSLSRISYEMHNSADTRELFYYQGLLHALSRFTKHLTGNGEREQCEWINHLQYLLADGPSRIALVQPTWNMGSRFSLSKPIPTLR